MSTERRTESGERSEDKAGLESWEPASGGSFAFSSFREWAVGKGVSGGLVMVGVAIGWYFVGSNAFNSDRWMSDRMVLSSYVLLTIGVYAILKGFFRGNYAGSFVGEALSNGRPVNLLNKEQECPYCHSHLELSDEEQKEKHFECPDCRKIADFREGGDWYRVNILPRIFECLKCSSLIELDEGEQVKKQFVCPCCRGSVDFTVKSSEHRAVSGEGEA